jgi:hypothetical protein
MELLIIWAIIAVGTSAAIVEPKPLPVCEHETQHLEKLR